MTQTKQQHTPGPFLEGEWLARFSSEYATWIVDSKTERGYMFICECDTGANARLIAAAPELVEALNRLTIMVEDYLIRKENNLPLPVLKPDIDKAKQALAKAEAHQ